MQRQDAARVRLDNSAPALLRARRHRHDRHHLRHVRPALAGLLIAAMAGGSVYAFTKQDPGADYEHSLAAQSQALFGFGHPLDGGATGSTNAPGTAAIEAAKGLEVELVSDAVGQHSDMIALWPDDADPTHAFLCNEINSTTAENLGKPTVQRVDLATGSVINMVTGTELCDPVHRTAWGTLVFGEESGSDGRLWELLDPMSFDGSVVVTVNRVTATSSDPARVVARLALGQLSYEGIVLLPDGTTYYSDELRPASGRPGGGMFKFAPTTPFSGGDAITNLSDSPLAAGKVHVMRLGLRTGGTDYGHGSNTGGGKWIPLSTPVNPLTFNLAAIARSAAVGGYTGYYRPEDIDLDPAAWADGRIRMCWNNTGNDLQANWGETLCLEDVADDPANFPTGRQPVVEPFVIGNPELRRQDNLDFQPGTGILYLLQDATTSTTEGGTTNDSAWACLPDGADIDILSDGCVRVLNSLDGFAEWSGIKFLADGKSFYINHMHRTQDGRAIPETTDLLRVSGLSIR